MERVGRARRAPRSPESNVSLLRSSLRHVADLASIPFSRVTPGASAALRGAPDDRDTTRVKRKGVRESLRASTAEGVVADVVGAFTGGAVQTGWALYLGCSPFWIGVLGAIPFLAQVLQLPAVWVSSRFGQRRVALVCVALSRQAYLPLVVLPLLPISQGAKQLVLIAVAAIAGVLGVVGNNAWTAWMADLVPTAIRGRYFGQRTAMCTLGGTAAALFAGRLLDGAKGGEGTILALLSLLACVAGLVTTSLMAKQHDPGDRPKDASLGGAIEALRNPRARPYLLWLVAWNGAIGITSAFIALHMLQNLRVGFTVVALHAAGIGFVRILAAPVWGRVIDRIGARPVLVACSFGIASIPGLWLLTTPDRLWPIVADCFVAGVLWSGHGLATFSMPLAMTPRDGRRMYLACFSTAAGVAFAIASATAGAVADALPHELVVFGMPFFGLHVLFATGCVARLAAASLSLKVEPHAKPIETLVPAIRAELVGGLRRSPFLSRWR